MSSALPVEPLSGKLPSRELLLAEVEAAEDRAAGIREVAARYGVYHGTVRRHLRGVQGQGAANVAQSEAPRVAEVLNSLPDDHDLSDADVAAEFAIDDAPPAAAEEPFEDPGPEQPGTWHEGERYVYNGDLDTYTFFMRTSSKKQVLQGATIRAMKRAYSRMGDASTINEIARSFEMRRDHFYEIKTILGWTHDSDAFTDEEILSKETSTLVEDAVQMRRSQLDQQMNKRNWKDTQRDAERFRNLEHFIVEPIIERLAEIAPLLQPPPMILIPRSTRRFAALTSSGELHYGKQGWIGETGEVFDRAVADNRLARTTEAMMSEIQIFGRPEEIIYVVGNDDLHVDGAHPETSAGTPMDVNATGRQMIDEFYEIQVREIQRLRSISPVRIVLSAGNHNTFSAYMVMKMLNIQFASAADVTVQLTARMRSYVRYGNSLLGMTHGHLIKPINLMATMGVEARADFGGAMYKYWFTGHLHSLAAENLVGGTRYQMPALSGPDRWHVESGFLGMAGLSGYIIDRDYGVVNTILCPAVDGLPAPDCIPANRYNQSAA
jgi:hypothetical protein